jgi:hypothetical protein
MSKNTENNIQNLKLDWDEVSKIISNRFKENMDRHPGLDWEKIEERLAGQPEKQKSLTMMESTGGEPDVIGYDKETDQFIFCDCSPETPEGRRSLCYDKEALDSRKENKPETSAMEMATEMGIEILSEDQYRALQQLGKFDAKTSSWIKTPADVRKLGGALFADFRFGRVFVYHNGAQSYYSGRAFRGRLLV